MASKSSSKTKDKSTKKLSSKSVGSKEKENLLAKKLSKNAKEPTAGHCKSICLAASSSGAPTPQPLSSATHKPNGGSSRKLATPSTGHDEEEKDASQGMSKKYRHKPANVDVLDSSDGPDSGPAKRKAPSTHEDDDDDKDENENEDHDEHDTDLANENSVESEKEEDLVGLTAAKAKEALQHEQPQWSSKKDNAQSQQDAKLENCSHKKPESLTKCKHRGSDTGTDASLSSKAESDSESCTSSSDSDTSNSLDNDSSAASNEDDRHNIIARVSHSLKKSKKADNRRSESAKWADNRKVSGPVKHCKTKAQDINAGWPSKAHYVAPIGCSITLKAQPKRLQIVLKKAIEKAEGDILFINAFPSGVKLDSYIRKLLSRHAQDHKNHALIDRIKGDPAFVTALTPLITGHMNRIRGRVKNYMSSSAIKATYNLPKAVSECHVKVAELQKSMDYIYPLGPNSTVDRSKPYCNDLIISILREYIFSGRPSIASKFSDRFESSLKTDKNNVEIPIAMLALAGTAISAGLDNWSTGEYKKKDCNTETHSGAYENHVEFITTSIFEADKKKYHSLTAKLYQLALNTPAQVSRSVDISNVQSNFNIADMAEDNSD